MLTVSHEGTVVCVFYWPSHIMCVWLQYYVKVLYTSLIARYYSVRVNALLWCTSDGKLNGVGWGGGEGGVKGG